MNEFISNIIIPVIVAFATAKITLRQDIRQRIYEKREENYLELYNLLLKLEDNPYLIYNNVEMVNRLQNLWPKLNVFASSELIETFKPLYKKIEAIAEEYWNLFSGPDYENRKSIQMEYEDKTEQDFEHEEVLYQETHLLDNEYFSKKIVEIVNLIKKDMGTR